MFLCAYLGRPSGASLSLGGNFGIQTRSHSVSTTRMMRGNDRRRLKAKVRRRCPSSTRICSSNRKGLGGRLGVLAAGHRGRVEQLARAQIVHDILSRSRGNERLGVREREIQRAQTRHRGRLWKGGAKMRISVQPKPQQSYRPPLSTAATPPHSLGRQLSLYASSCSCLLGRFSPQLTYLALL
jgi:hypothetical protein